MPDNLLIPVIHEIKLLLENSKSSVSIAVNSHLLKTYWSIG